MYSRLKASDQLSWQVFASWAFHASTVKHLSALLAGFALVGSLWAAPSELNFQGVLLDSAGNGVTGTRAMTVKLYDAAIGGNLLYTEDLGNVAVNKGVYSFNFGTNGTGNPKVTEIVAITDGTNSTFQKILSNTNVVAGSVTVTDGTYTWDQANGSSDGGVNFDASYSSSLRRITVTYYGSVPTVGKTIAVSYRSPSAGVENVLIEDAARWIEVSIQGSAQSPRQKILAVPFAIKASSVTADAVKLERKIKIPIRRFNIGGFLNTTFPISATETTSHGSGYPPTKTGVLEIPSFVKKIVSLTIKYSNLSYTVSSPQVTLNGNVSINVQNSMFSPLFSTNYSLGGTNVTKVIHCNVPIEFGSQSLLQFSASAGEYWYGGQPRFAGNATIHSLEMEVETHEAVSW